MKKLIGLIVAVIIIISSIAGLKGTGQYIGSFVGVIVGIATSIVLRGIAIKKYKRSILAVILVTITGAVLLFFIVTLGYLYLVDVHDFFAIEHSLDVQLHGSYTIDTSGIKNHTETKENEPFTYFLQLETGNKTSNIHNRNYTMKEYGLVLPDELLDDIASASEYSYVILSFGRELAEVRYKYLGYFSDGVTSKGKMIFCEEYQDDIVYVYFIKKNVYVWEATYYVLERSKKVFIR